MASVGLSPGDPNSYSRPDLAAVTHLHLDLYVDFEKKVLNGEVLLTVEKRVENIDTVILDSRDIKVTDVACGQCNTKLKYQLYDASEFGSKFEIRLCVENKCNIIKIQYSTSPNSTALQWLDPEQTAGQVHPYMYSQCQPIHCRAMIPCQDTPSIKATYSAQISTEKPLTALMSALRDGEPVDVPDNKRLFKFIQKVPIPVYLIAIAVGVLESRDVSSRCKVWSEKEIVDKAAYEFSETEKMLSTAEEICGDYVWGIYDLLILPPSFPYGGMENPCLTFVTPTLLAGDRSLADVVVHEITHSWTGNLVTNKNFEHFWLNEGFTMFVERKITARLLTSEQRQFQASGGLKDLKATINELGAENPFTCLVPDLKGIDPDEAFSTVPYEKGHTLLYHLEELAGGPEKFDPFLRDYINTFKYQSIVTDDFINFLLKYFPENEKLKSFDWNLWLHSPGMPPVIPDYTTDLEKACTELREKWIQWDCETVCPFSTEDISTFSPLQVREFLAQLLQNEALPLKKLEAMESLYKMPDRKNSEIRFRWLQLCLRGRWNKYIDSALEFVTTQGRMKFIKDIYSDLYKWEEARDATIATFKKNIFNMMPISRLKVSQVLHLNLSDL